MADETLQAEDGEDTKKDSNTSPDKTASESVYGPGIPNDFDPDMFKITNEEDFTAENLVLTGTVHACIKLTEELSATYRALTSAELQQLEKDTWGAEGSPYFNVNEAYIQPMILSILSLEYNGKKAPLSEDSKERDTQVRAMAGPVVSELVRGYSWFSLKTILLLRGTSLKKS